MVIEFVLTNLNELREVAHLIQKEVAAHSGRFVHPAEILVGSLETNNLTLRLTDSRLSDGSTVYNVEAE